MHFRWVCLLFMVSYSSGTLHPNSPCPDIFSYEGAETERDRWFGTVQLSTDESLVGVRLDIKLDRPTQLLVSWLGEVTTEDNERFTILSLSQKLHPGPALLSRFMVKFNTSQGNPQVLTIRLNGRQICPPDPNFIKDLQNKYQSNSMKNSTERATRRPDPDFEDNWGPASTEYTRRTTKRYDSEEYEHNPPKRENNNFFQENVVTHSTTRRYYNSEEEYPNRPNNYENNYDNKGNKKNNERFSTTERYNNFGDDGSDFNNYNQKRTTHKPNYGNDNDGSNEQTSTIRTNNIGDVRTESSNQNQQQTTHKPNYEDENERINEKVTSTTKYNIGDVRPGSNNYNQQRTTPKSDHENENEESNDKFSSTTNYNIIDNASPGPDYYNQQITTQKPNYKNLNEGNNEYLSSTTKYDNIGDIRPGPHTYNPQKTTHKPDYVNEYEDSHTIELSSTERYKNTDEIREYDINNDQKTTPKTSLKNENERNNNNLQFPTTVRYNNIGDKTDRNQQKTTRKPVTVSYKHTTPKAINKVNTKLNPNINNQPPKSDYSSPELHLSTNYQVNTGQSNKFPSIPTKTKNDTINMKGTNLNLGKTTKVPAKDTPVIKYQKSDSLGTPIISTECGKVEIPPAPLITNGQNTARGQWPWHIALYKIDGINLSYICGGSLVSSSVVVTAAHCVTKSASGRPVDADILVVYLGKYHLYQFSDDGGVQNKQVRDVHVHPEYNHTNFHNDIAVLTLTSPVEYTTYVRPVCLWNGDDTELNAVEGEEGTVVGWGYDENDEVTEELKMARMPVVSQQTCIWSYPQFFSQFTSNKTFCAGFREGTSVCNGDSGGGMVFSRGSSWYLRGLVSITVARQGLKVCDTAHYVVFTDAAKYLNWITQYIT